jgi:hypothetical protein
VFSFFDPGISWYSSVQLKRLFAAVVCGIALCVGCAPQFQLNKSNYAENDTIYTVWHVDTRFSTRERAAIFQATQEWQQFARGKVEISLIFDLDYSDPSILRDERLLIYSSSKSRAISQADKEVKRDDPDAYTLGLFEKDGVLGTPTISIAMDRIWSERMLKSVVQHELGHSLGLAHTKGIGVMNAMAGCHCLTLADAEDFCGVYGCKPADLNYCDPSAP